MVHLTRELRFSIAFHPDQVLEQPRELANTWAGWPGVSGLACYVRLRATFAGQPDPVTDYLCDIKQIDEFLQETAVPLCNKMWQEAGPSCTSERFLLTLGRSLPPEPFPGAQLIRLQLVPEPYLHYTWYRDQPDMIQFTEQFEFSAAHRLHCAEFSEQQNRDLFGKCNNPAGHGHNYVVEVTVAASPETSRNSLEKIVKECVLDRFDHKHLNEDCAEFRNLNPTVENITRVIWQLLAGPLKPISLIKVRLYETPKTWAEYSGDEKQ